MNTAVLLLLALSTKHFIIDFLLQYPYQYLNKGTYGHPGGLMHASLHAVGTAISLALCGLFDLIWVLSAADAVIHYHIDWAKMNLNKHYGWACNTSDKFWTLIGLDQYLHMLTYLAIAYIVTQ